MSTCPEHAATRSPREPGARHARLPVWKTRLEVPSGPAPGPGPVLVPPPLAVWAPPPPDPASAPVNRAAPPVPPSDASHRSRPEPSLVASSGKPPAPPPSPVVPVPGPPRARPRARRRALTLALLSRLPPRDGGTCERRSTTRVARGHVGSLGPALRPTPHGAVRGSAHSLAGGGAAEVPGLHGPHVHVVLFARDHLLLLGVPAGRHDSPAASVSLA